MQQGNIVEALPLTQHRSSVYLDRVTCTDWVAMLSLQMICPRIFNDLGKYSDRMLCFNMHRYSNYGKT